MGKDRRENRRERRLERRSKRSLPVRIVLTVVKVIVIAGVALVAVILILVAVYMPRNTKAMEQGVSKAMDAISSHANVKELDAGEYQHLRLFGIMNFKVQQYEVEDIGNLSVMTMNAGLMQMSTVILTPLEKDVPLISTDYMYILGNRTSYLECYDLVLDKGEKYQDFLGKLRAVKADYADLDTATPSADWYDDMRTVGIYMKGKAADDGREEEALTSWIDAAMNYSEKMPVLSEAEREEKMPVVRTYTDGLIEKGGISTDFFVKALGKDKTRDFFDTVLFGTGRDNS